MKSKEECRKEALECLKYIDSHYNVSEIIMQPIYFYLTMCQTVEGDDKK